MVKFSQLCRDFSHTIEPNTDLVAEFKILCHFENEPDPDSDVAFRLAMAYTLKALDRIDCPPSLKELYMNAMQATGLEPIDVGVETWPPQDCSPSSLVSWHMIERVSASKRNPKRLLDRLATLPTTPDQIMTFYEEVKKAGASAYDDYDAAIEMLTKHSTTRAWSIRAILRLALAVNINKHAQEIHDDLIDAIVDLECEASARIYVEGGWPGRCWTEYFRAVLRRFAGYPQIVLRALDKSMEWHDITAKMVWHDPNKGSMSLFAGAEPAEAMGAVTYDTASWLPAKTRRRPDGTTRYVYSFAAKSQAPIKVPFDGQERKITVHLAGVCHIFQQSIAAGHKGPIVASSAMPGLPPVFVVYVELDVTPSARDPQFFSRPVSAGGDCKFPLTVNGKAYDVFSSDADHKMDAWWSYKLVGADFDLTKPSVTAGPLALLGQELHGPGHRQRRPRLQLATRNHRCVPALGQVSHGQGPDHLHLPCPVRGSRRLEVPAGFEPHEVPSQAQEDGVVIGVRRAKHPLNLLHQPVMRVQPVLYAGQIRRDQVRACASADEQANEPFHLLVPRQPGDLTHQRQRRQDRVGVAVGIETQAQCQQVHVRPEVEQDVVRLRRGQLGQQQGHAVRRALEARGGEALPLRPNKVQCVAAVAHLQALDDQMQHLELRHDRLNRVVDLGQARARVADRHDVRRQARRSSRRPPHAYHRLQSRHVRHLSLALRSGGYKIDQVESEQGPPRTRTRCRRSVNFSTTLLTSSTTSLVYGPSPSCCAIGKGAVCASTLWRTSTALR